MTLINTIDQRGKDLIKQFEGCRLEAYQDESGTWTIGYGHTLSVYAGQKIDQPTAEQWFEQDILSFAARVAVLLSREPSQQQFDALVSLAFNIGIPAFASSTVLSRFNANDDISAANSFGRWDKIHVGRKLVQSAGLSHRRAAETTLFLEGVNQEPATALARIVPKAADLSGSGTMRGGQLASLATVLTALTALIDQTQQTAMNLPWVGQLAQFMIANQPKLVWALCAVGLGSILYMCWRRIQDHERGYK